MSLRSFDWDERNVEHLADHGADPSEAEEVLRRNPYKRKIQEEKWLAYGRTYDGRYLFVVFALKGKNRIRVITARDMTEREKSSTRKRFKG